MTAKGTRLEYHAMSDAAILTEQFVGMYADDIFCSLLFDRQNRTLRMVDFKSGKFPVKQKYLERTLMAEGMRKVFTLVEHSEVSGWRKIGYHREGTIPAYFNRSDAHIMSCIYDDKYDIEAAPDKETSELKSFLHKVEILAAKMSNQKKLSVQVDQITEEKAIEAIGKELQRRKANAKKSKKSKVEKNPSNAGISDRSARAPIFCQFGREVEHLYFAAKRSRTEQTNVIGAEYQDNFNNAKVDIFFPPKNQPDSRVIRSFLIASIEVLREMGVKAVFSMVSEETLLLNALYWSAGFSNTGRLCSQRLNENGPQNLLLWTRKLERPQKEHNKHFGRSSEY
ncbi:MAG: hypothetical protein GY847_31655 [Proteobacteria bacterium]|nr:hypothetical protein [Pseudomonadota bacterium]